MDYKQREWLDEWSSAHIVATIVDAIPDLDISDGDTQIRLMHTAWFDEPNSPIHQRNLGIIRRLLAVLSDFHAAYLAALGDGVTAGTDASIVTEVKCSE